MSELDSTANRFETVPPAEGRQQAREISYPGWQPLFHAALLETQTSLLGQKIVAAEKAIEERQRQLLAHGVHQNPAVHEELTAISGAMSSLNILRRELKTD